MFNVDISKLLTFTAFFPFLFLKSHLSIAMGKGNKKIGLYSTSKLEIKTSIDLSDIHHVTWLRCGWIFSLRHFDQMLNWADHNEPWDYWLCHPAKFLSSSSKLEIKTFTDSNCFEIFFLTENASAFEENRSCCSSTWITSPSSISSCGKYNGNIKIHGLNCIKPKKMIEKYVDNVNK